jgi:hypothetical protein
MARRLSAFGENGGDAPRRYPWADWTDGQAWEITRGDDYDVATENMRVILHLRAGDMNRKVRTRKVRDERGESLVFQFLDPDGQEIRQMLATAQPQEVHAAMEELYEDAIEIYERARREVTIPRSDGTEQKYAAVRFKQAIDKAHDEGTLITTVARIVRKPTAGLAHLEAAGRYDLMLENLVIDEAKPYHRFFATETIETAQARMAQYRDGAQE